MKDLGYIPALNAVKCDRICHKETHAYRSQSAVVAVIPLNGFHAACVLLLRKVTAHRITSGQAQRKPKDERRP
jgi:hypothetical protein